MSASLVVELLRAPERAASLPVSAWNGVIAAARAEQLIGTLAHRIADQAIPTEAKAVMADARAAAEQGQAQALWEAEMARRALAPLGIEPVLLKGTAYAAARLQPAIGRSIGDLDILVPLERLAEAEAALLGAGWEWVKPDPYDDAYYRRWMHELPPLIHRARDRMIDVHHTILPPTARPKPDAALMLAEAVELPGGFRVLKTEDMVIHAAAHLFADGDLSGGLRNLWDIHCLLTQCGTAGLEERAERHGLLAAVHCAARQAHALFGTRISESWRLWDSFDPLIRRRLLARDGWGHATRPVTRLGFYVRSHWLRMPPLMLARHLTVKAFKGSRARG